MTHEVRITSRAHQEFCDAIRWDAENYSSDFASRWNDAFHRRLELLNSTAESYPLAHEDGLTTFQLRELCFGLGRHPSHHAVFRIAGTTVEVLTIRHVAQRDLEPDDVA